ncbi:MULTISPECIES: hypothetical protein [unclassified Streptomyces]|uniref:hypothetical protein n=1 Tax=unclassified Streptomyces TaxID=2593676 RepID=UPI0022505335|nr:MULTISPECIES: hypothetical protein [unclassified Streptomyces]MCX5335584.1 hypothetical protein [Streptomyces sp. NBC_00140]MCX5366302.1 hypothetical protein [Streptomyces sp. NBC_00124]
MSHDSTPPPMPGYTPPPAPGYLPPPQPPQRPNRTTTVLVAAAAAVVAAVLAAVVTARVGGDGEAEAAPTVTVTRTVPADSGDTVADTDSDEPTEEATAEEAGEDSYGFDDTIVYDNDVEISLSKFSRAVSSDYAAPENTPYAKFTIKIVNRSDKKVDASMMTVNCAYGDEGKEGEAIYDDGLDGLPDTSILAGRSLSVPWGCELPKGENFLQIEVAPDYESETSIFTGEVKK